jgi:glycosyltransferase involved in cell wall biosynthesis
MRIAYVSTARIPDDWGHVIQIMKMCEAFADAGHTVELIVPLRARTRRDDPYAFVGAKPVFTITKLPCIDLSATGDGKVPYWLRTVSFFLSVVAYRFLKRHDLVFTREPAARFFVQSFVFEAHAVSPSVIAAAKAAQAVVAITSFIREELIDAGVYAERILVAPDAVDLTTFAHTESKESARTRLGLPLDTKIALYLGRVDRWKGMDALFAAAALLPKDTRIAVIGAEEKDIPELHRLYPDSMFIPFRPYKEVADNQAAADVLLLPNTGQNAMSARYTSPLKLFTYMASGIPIIASDIPSVREIVDDASALLVAPDDAEALAEGIIYTLQHAEQACVRAKHARTLVERYTWDARARAILTSIHT